MGNNGYSGFLSAGDVAYDGPSENYRGEKFRLLIEPGMSGNYLLTWVRRYDNMRAPGEVATELTERYKRALEYFKAGLEELSGTHGN